MRFPSTDLEATATFFERHLGCTVTAYGANHSVKRPGFDIIIEKPDDGQVAWPETFHLGFELPTAKDVRDPYDRVKRPTCSWRRGGSAMGADPVFLPRARRLDV